MHIALFAPYSKGPTRGNIITVQRIARNLTLHGISTCIIPLDSLSKQEISQQLAANPPSVIHAFHAFHAGPLAKEIAQERAIPYVVSITGSDLFDPDLRDHPATHGALIEAAAVSCFDQIIAQQLTLHFPAITDRLSVIPQGVEPLVCSIPFARPEHAFITLLPAALRPAKGVLEAIDALAPLAAADTRLQLWLAGGELDTGYGDRVRQRIAGENWIRVYGEVPHEQMGAFYAASDLVLNSSLFEGGMANTLLEAMACAKPIIASDIPGNRSLLQTGGCGWLYSSPQELQNLVYHLLADSSQLGSIGYAAQQYVLQHFSLSQETEAFSRLYQTIIQNHTLPAIAVKPCENPA